MRPVYLLALNDPDGRRRDLDARRTDSLGQRLWSMANGACGITLNEWMQITRRSMLLSVPVLPRDYRSGARRRGDLLTGLLGDAPVVLLGADVAYAMRHDARPLEWAGTRVYVPPPCNRNGWYQEAGRRALAGRALGEALELAGWCPF